MHEDNTGENKSHRNEYEAQLVDTHVRSLLDAGIKQDHIGIITPYNGQLELLKSTVAVEYPGIEIKTVSLVPQYCR
jgi:superfamily I DNA and/or RNA helicase